jgi:hypothetical protein
MGHDNGAKLLNMYRGDFPCYNDDLQVWREEGAGAVLGWFGGVRWLFAGGGGAVRGLAACRGGFPCYNDDLRVGVGEGCRAGGRGQQRRNGSARGWRRACAATEHAGPGRQCHPTGAPQIAPANPAPRASARRSSRRSWVRCPRPAAASRTTPWCWRVRGLGAGAGPPASREGRAAGGAGPASALSSGPAPCPCASSAWRLAHALGPGPAPQLPHTPQQATARRRRASPSCWRRPSRRRRA